MTVHTRVAAARARLRAAGIPPDEGDIDVRLLAQHLLGWDATQFFTSANEAEPEGFAARFDALVSRRAAREPLAYIIGRQEFWGLDFDVSPDVLIPRPETESLVEVALELISPVSAVDVLDICTGSGCIAVAIAHERPHVQVVATDAAEAALTVARANAARHRVEGRITFRRADLFSGLETAFDLIVSNPPYVREPDRPGLQPEVRDYEPPLALFAGPQGLDVIARLVVRAPARLKPGGTLAFEFGFGQGDDVSRLIAETTGLTMVGLRPDLQGIPRVAIATRTEDTKTRRGGS